MIRECDTIFRLHLRGFPLFIGMPYTRPERSTGLCWSVNDADNQAAKDEGLHWSQKLGHQFFREEMWMSERMSAYNCATQRRKR